VGFRDVAVSRIEPRAAVPSESRLRQPQTGVSINRNEQWQLVGAVHGASLAGSFSRAVYSDCDHNLLIYVGAESSVLSENLLKTLRIRVDFDSTIRKFESSRPGEHLSNKIRRFLNLADFHSDGPPRSHR
jgi:hypothetical protein